VTYKRRPLFADENNVDLLRSAFRYAMDRKPFDLGAIVILPDHVHCIWSMTNDVYYSKRWQMIIKTHFSRKMDVPINLHGVKQVWQPRFWEHCIRDDNDYQRHIDYIHYNPVKHGFVPSVKDWPHSSFQRFVKKGWYEENWGQNIESDVLSMDVE